MSQKNMYGERIDKRAHTHHTHTNAQADDTQTDLA